MAKKPKTSKLPAADKSITENLPSNAAKVRKRVAGSQWLAGAAPWESYGEESASMREGIAALADDGKTEVFLGSIEDVAGGKLKVTHTKFPGTEKNVEEDSKDGLLSLQRYKTKPQTAQELMEGKTEVTPLREDSFAAGGQEGGRVIFSADAFYYILLTDDQKYRAMQNSYKFYREDPIYRGMINALLNFIIGTGLVFKATDENLLVNDYIQQFWKINKMTGKDSECIKRFLLTGEIALRYYKKGNNGIAAKFPAVRLIPFWRLAEVLKDPQDAETIVGYRIWEAAGPYRPMIKQEMVGPDDMLFWKNSTPEEDRGEPPLLATLKPCKWYQDWMQNRVILNRFRTAIVLFKKIKSGTPPKVSAVSSADPNATTEHMGLSGKLEKRLPKSGSVVTHNDSIDYDWKSPNLQASDAGEDGRKILLYIAVAAQIPEFILGDASNANYSNLMVAENPFVRQVEAWRSFFGAFFSEMFRIVIQQGIDTGQLPKNSTETKIAEGSKWVGMARKFLKKIGLSEADTDDNGNVKTTRAIPTRTDVEIDWPSIIYKNQLVEAQTFQLHQSMGLASKETLRGKCGYDNDIEKQRLAAEGEEDQDEFEKNRQAALDADAAAAGTGDPNEPGRGSPAVKGKDSGTAGGDPARQGYGKA